MVLVVRTGDVDRIVGTVVSKGSQVHGGGVIADLSRTTVTVEQLGNIGARVAGGTSRVSSVVILP